MKKDLDCDATLGISQLDLANPKYTMLQKIEVMTFCLPLDFSYKQLKFKVGLNFVHL
jgi:hypothetical protein